MRHKKVKNVYREIYNVIYNINNMDRYSIFCLCRSSLEAQAAEKYGIIMYVLCSSNRNPILKSFLSFNAFGEKHIS